MRRLLAAAVLVLLSRAARATDDDPSEKLTDPDMVSAGSTVEEANLENILYTADKEAKRSLEHVHAILTSARGVASGIADELGEGRDEEVKTSVDLLEAKAEKAAEKTAEASIMLPELSYDAWLSRRAGYRAKDREKDLKRLELAFSKARPRFPKADLAFQPVQDELLAAVREFRQELDHFRRLAAGPRARERAAQLEAQSADLSREALITETAWRLKRLDAAAFSAAPKKKKKRKI